MQGAEKVEEPVRVYVRIRPRIENIPTHSGYQQARKQKGHNPDCIAVLDTNTLKIIPNAQCQCKECLKRHALDHKLDRAATGRGKKEKFFRFDKIYTGSTTQDELYEGVADLVLSCVQGVSATVFTYGPTGTGKSHTMCGSKSDLGIIPRVIEDTFQIIDNTKAQDLDVYFHVDMSYVELYNNSFRNLLKQLSDELTKIEKAGGNIDQPTELERELLRGIDEAFDVDAAKIPDLSHNTDKMALFESPTIGVFLSGHNLRVPVRSVKDALSYYSLGNKMRKIGSTPLNDCSSRGHAILTLHVESKLGITDSPEPASMKITRSMSRSFDDDPNDCFSPPDGSGEKYDVRLGKINLVDLAGSERLSESNATGTTATETQFINKSLLALGEVLHALANNTAAKTVREEMHVPYFNSKLTHFLRDALGGNNRTTMICNVGSEADMYNHSLYSLMFAARGLKVRNCVGLIRVVVEAEAEGIEDEADIIRTLKNRIMSAASGTPLKAAKSQPSVKKQAALGRALQNMTSPAPSRSARVASKAAAVSKAPGGSGNSTPRGAAAATGPKRMTLRLSRFIAQDLKYVSFPLAPRLKITVGKQTRETERRVYHKSAAKFKETYEFALDPEEYKAGLAMEITAINVSPFGTSSLIGAGKVELQSVVVENRPKKEVDSALVVPGSNLVIPLKDDTPLSCGQIVLVAQLLDRAPDPAFLPPDPATVAKRRGSRRGAGAGAGDDDDASVMSTGSSKSGSAASLQTAPTTPTGKAAATEKPSGIVTIRSIICTDMPLDRQSHQDLDAVANPHRAGTPQATPDMVGDYTVSLQIGQDRRYTPSVRGKLKAPPSTRNSKGAVAATSGTRDRASGTSNGKEASHDSAAAATPVHTVFASFDKPGVSFVVDPDQIHWDSIEVTVFEGPASDDAAAVYVGKASGQLLPLQGIMGGEGESSTDTRDFALQLKDVDHRPTGRIVLRMHMSRIKPLFDGTESSNPSSALLPKTTRSLRDVASSPRLGNVRVPKGFKNGWVRINSITGVNLNKFQLIGKHARHKHLRDTPFSPVGKDVKQSDVLGLQDPFVVCEVGDFWLSYTKVLLDQSWNCQWDQLNFSCYVTSDDASTKDLKLTVYDRRYGNGDAYIGTCLVPLVNFFAGPLKSESVTEVPVVDRHGKYNGKLAVSTVCTGTELGGERWSNATVTAVHPLGRYDVAYDDGQEEQLVHKDFMRLVPGAMPSSAAAVGANSGAGAGAGVTPLKPKRINLGDQQYQARFKAGEKVEVNQLGRGVWLPAIIKSDNEDGTYDLESDYAMEKVNISEVSIRPASSSGAATPVSPRGLTASGPGGGLSRAPSSQVVGNSAKGRFKLRDKVEGNFKSKGTWYPGTIWKVREYDTYLTYDVDYDMGEMDKGVPEELLRPADGRNSRAGAAAGAGGTGGGIAGGAGPSAGGRGLVRQGSSTIGPSAAPAAGRGMGAMSGRGGPSGRPAGVPPLPVTPQHRGSMNGKANFATPENGASSLGPDPSPRPTPRASPGASPLGEGAAGGGGAAGGAFTRKGSFIAMPGGGPGIGAVEASRSKYHPGDRVLANYRGHGTFLPGTIEYDYENGLYDVTYDGGETDSEVTEDLIQLMSDMDPSFNGPTRDKFHVGDKVTANYREIGRWLPGTITRDRGHGVYDIHYNEGRNETKVAMENIKLVEANPHKPAKKSRFEASQRVEVNTEGLGQWFPAEVVKVVGIGIYDVLYDDGTYDFDVDDELLRNGGAYTPAIPCTKPVFKLGDRVRVACRAPEVEKEQRSLAAIKQRIAEERALLGGEQQKAEEQREELKKRDLMAYEEEEELEGFKRRVWKAQLAYDAEHGPKFKRAMLRRASSTGRSGSASRAGSVSFVAGRTASQDDLSGDPSKAGPEVTVGKVITVEVSLAKLARRRKEYDVALADKARLGCVEEMHKADKLAERRGKDEAKALQRTDSPATEAKAFRDAFEKAEQELADLMAARKLAMDENTALEKANRRSLREAKSFGNARRKGEFAMATLRDRHAGRAELRRSLDDGSDLSPRRGSKAGAEAEGRGNGSGASTRRKSALMKMTLASDPDFEAASCTPKPLRHKSGRLDSDDSLLPPSSTVDLDEVYPSSADSAFGEEAQASTPSKQAVDYGDIYGAATPTATPKAEPSVPVDSSMAFDFDFQDVEDEEDDDDDDYRKGSLVRGSMSASRSRDWRDGTRRVRGVGSLDDLYDAVYLAATGNEDGGRGNGADSSADDAGGYDAIYDGAGSPRPATNGAGANGNCSSSADADSPNGKMHELGPCAQLKASAAEVADAKKALAEAVLRAEQARKRFGEANAAVKRKTDEVAMVHGAVAKNESSLDEEAKASPRYQKQYLPLRKAANEADEAVLVLERTKEGELEKADQLQQEREMEIEAAHALDAQKQADDQQASTAMMSHNPQAALRALKNAQKHVDGEVAALQSAIRLCEAETAALESATKSADQERAAAAEARKRGIEFAMALVFVKNEQKERDLAALRAAKEEADKADHELEEGKESASVKHEEHDILREQIDAALQAIKAMKTKAAAEQAQQKQQQQKPGAKRDTPVAASVSAKRKSDTTAKERAELQERADAAGAARREQEEKAQQAALEREALEEEGQQAEERCALEEANADAALEESRPLVR